MSGIFIGGTSPNYYTITGYSSPIFFTGATWSVYSDPDDSSLIALENEKLKEEIKTLEAEAARLAEQLGLD